MTGQGNRFIQLVLGERAIKDRQMIKQICQMPILIVNNYLIFNLANGTGNLELIHIFIKVKPDYST